MSLVTTLSRFGFMALVAVAMFAGLAFVAPQTTSAEEVPYIPLTILKVVTDNFGIGDPDFETNQFKFKVTHPNGDVENVPVVNDANDYSGTALVNLRLGTTIIEQINPTGFVPADWRFSWYGNECSQNKNGYVTQIVIDETNIDHGYLNCEANDQYRPQNDNGDDIPGCMDDSYDNYNPNATVDDGSCANDEEGGTGTIVIVKQTLPDGNQTAFTFNPSWSETDFSLTDGAQKITTGLAAGTYSVVETLPTNWTQTSVVCSDGSTLSAISLQADETVTCTVTNTQNNGGGGDNDPQTYLVYGYVWHDENSNTNWEIDNPETEEVETMEVDLDGWTVTITNGSVTYSTTTDSTGYYYFYVPVGIWTISETLQTDWNQTAPTTNSGTHVVNVGGVPVVTQSEDGGFLATLWSYVVPTAYAQSATTYGPFNFGNVFFGTGGCSSNCGGGGGNNDDDDDNRSGGSSGTRTNRGNGGNPTPTVLGDATTTIPVGAPDTGAGGTSVPFAHVPALVIAVSVQVRTRKNV